MQAFVGGKIINFFRLFSFFFLKFCRVFLTRCPTMIHSLHYFNIFLLLSTDNFIYSYLVFSEHNKKKKNAAKKLTFFLNNIILFQAGGAQQNHKNDETTDSLMATSLSNITRHLSSSRQGMWLMLRTNFEFNVRTWMWKM